MKDNYIQYKGCKIKKRKIPNIGLCLFLLTISLFLCIWHPVFVINENQILYLYSSASQVLAGIYGLIITGYIFLRNELDRKVDKDETFEEVISILKADYFSSIISITFVTIISITLCFLVIVSERVEYWTLSSVLINITGSVILTDFFIIATFVIKILNPKNIEITSDKLRTEISKAGNNKNTENGDIGEFLNNYNKIENIITKYGTIDQPDVESYRSARRKRFSNAKLARILHKDGRIDQTLMEDLIILISFRNSFIHGTDLDLYKEDVIESEKVLNALKKSLSVN